MNEYFQGINFSLLIQFLVYSALTIVILYREVKLHPLYLLLLVIFKFGTVFLIFSFLDLSDWLKNDDIVYFNTSKELLSQNYDVFSIETFKELIYLNGGIHIMYSWLNMLLHSIFGIYYFSTVFFNVFLTFLCGMFIYNISMSITGKINYSIGLLIFFCVHWDILTWSSFLNLKDIVVLFLTLAFFEVFFCRFSCKPISSLGLLLFISLVFYWTRFYVPLLIALSYLIYLFRPKFSIILKVVSSIAFLFIFIKILGFESLAYYLAKLNFGTQTIMGAIRFILTPLPWQIEDSYIFLLFASLMHFIFLLPSFLGGIQLLHKYRQVSFIFIFFVVCLIVYGSFPDLQGPRHRIQVSFVIIWFQYHGIYTILRKFNGKSVTQ